MAAAMAVAEEEVAAEEEAAAAAVEAALRDIQHPLGVSSECGRARHGGLHWGIAWFC